MEGLMRKNNISTLLANCLVMIVVLVMLLALGLGAAEASHSHSNRGSFTRHMNFRVFWQDFLNVTDFIVVKGLPIGVQHFTATTAPFGTTAYFNDVLTRGPQPSSRPVGTAIGSAIIVSLDGTVNIVSMSFEFNKTHRNGTLNFFGPFLADVPSTLPIIGGTGDFFLSEGQAVFHPVNLTVNHATYRVDVTVLLP